MPTTIVDCYTDEPSGLGVPPFLGVYPRYLYGYLRSRGENPDYITIDDLRLHSRASRGARRPRAGDKTDIWTYNVTGQDIARIIKDTTEFIVILGVHVPGKYLSAMPGTLGEVRTLLAETRAKKTVTGPAVFGTQSEGGKFSEGSGIPGFETREFRFSFEDIDRYSLLGAGLVKIIPDIRIMEIETARGCDIGKCSFCTEPLKSRFETRKTGQIVNEVKALYVNGARHFRLGKQSDFYAIEDPIGLLKSIWQECPGIKVLHIDNVNPVSVIAPKGKEITRAISEYCTEGNVAALGVESFDPEVVKANKLNCSPEIAFKAVRIINEIGRQYGKSGLPRFLPGINLVFGLIGESRETHMHNFGSLKAILDEGLMLRRINIRQVAILPGTEISRTAKNRFLKKNKSHYWSWRNEIREKIDFPMLERLFPKGHVISNLYSEIHDGRNTFLRQIGTYPIIVGVKESLPLKEFYSARVTGHMLRSITCEIVDRTKE
jgi:radical SAM superfamily enzyme with C-terminal helix-hairpin-helix motif